MRNFLLGLFALTLTSSPLFGSTFTADPSRTVYIRGVVGGNALAVAGQIEKLSSDSERPIDIIINSPGGSILAGLQTISAMEVAKERGVTIRCFVPHLAASMAFQIFMHCDERYALEQTMLLFHPATVGGGNGFNTEDLLYWGDRLRKMELPLVKKLIKTLGVSRKFFFYHYRNETMWLGSELIKETTCFSLVTNFKNVIGPYETR